MKGATISAAGTLMNFMYLDHWQPETGNPRGQFDFRANVTELNRATHAAQNANFYNQYASFLLGLSATPPRACRTS
jgi:hypothetical protein